MAARNCILDIMKGIAILCVIAGHTYWLPKSIILGIYSFHIPLFFIVSGYFAKTFDEGQLSGKEYIRQNARKLLLPYLITAAFGGIYALIQSFSYHDMRFFTHELMRYVFAMDHTWEGTLLDTWVAPIWFLLALFWGRLVLFYISRIGVWTLPLCIFLSMVMIVVHPYVPLPWGIGWGIEALLFIAVGWAYRRYTFPAWLKAITVVCWMTSMYLGRIDICAFQFQCLPIDLLGACGGTLVVYYLSKGLSKTFIRPILEWCGRHSLEILCVHNVAMDLNTIYWFNKVLPFYTPVKVYHCIKHATTLFVVWLYSLLSERNSTYLTKNEKQKRRNSKNTKN